MTAGMRFDDVSIGLALVRRADATDFSVNAQRADHRLKEVIDHVQLAQFQSGYDRAKELQDAVARLVDVLQRMVRNAADKATASAPASARTLTFPRVLVEWEGYRVVAHEDVTHPLRVRNVRLERQYRDAMGVNSWTDCTAEVGARSIMENLLTYAILRGAE